MHSTDPTATPERDMTPETPARPPTANLRAPRAMVLLAALLHVGADELLGVLLEHLVDLVEDRIHVVGELLVPLPDFLCAARLGLFGLLGAPRGLPLTACVLRCHVATSVQSQRYRHPWQSRPIPPG